MNIPIEWKTVELNDYVKLINGFAFSSSNFSEGDGMPLIRIRDLENSDTEISYNGSYTDAYVVNHGDLLIGMDGDFNTVRWKGSDALLNQRVCKLLTKDGSLLSQNFLFFRIVEEIEKIHRVTAATTVKHLASKDVLQIEIGLPPIEEQTQIATILSTIDRAIEQTEAIIAKQQRIKTGLMQDLLTCGIDEQGNIRSEATHEFKDSPMGRIPVEWNVVTLGGVIKSSSFGKLQTGPFGSQLHSHEYVDDGIPVIMPQDILNSGVSTSNIARITEAKVQELKRHIVEVGDVIFARRGDLSRCAQISEIEKGWICGTGCLLLKTPKEFFSPWWVATIYRFHSTQKQISVNAVGSTMVNLNTQILSDLLIPQPSLSEQNRIEIAAQDLQQIHEQLVSHCQKLKRQKTGLMQDLLTGKVRVTDLLNLPTQH